MTRDELEAERAAAINRRKEREEKLARQNGPTHDSPPRPRFGFRDFHVGKKKPGRAHEYLAPRSK